MKLKNYKERIAAIPEETKAAVRSQNRIIEILGKNGFDTLLMESGIRSIYEGVMRSMDQYGKEQYCKGYSDCQKKNETIQSFANSIADDNARLVKLVQAQKELIEWMGIKLPSLSHENKCKMADFLNKIKELEQ